MVPPSFWRLISAHCCFFILVGFFSTRTAAFAQILGYESFSLPTGSGLSGSGTGATGWTDSGWTGGNDPHFSIVAPTPSLSYQIPGGQLVSGSTTALQVTTNPEPVNVLASRHITPTNTTIFVSFLVRPLVIGTGSDSFEVQLNAGAETVARVALVPDPSQESLDVQLKTYTSTFTTTFGTISPGQTALVVMRIMQLNPTTLRLDTIVNPTSTIPTTFPSPNPLESSGPTVPTLDTVAIKVFSSDTGGPTTTAIIDELRVGYTWNDVVPQSPVTLVPTLNITNAVNIQWQTQSGHTYQPQYSYDLNNWFNLGSSITGDGTIKSLFDPINSQAQKFYQVQVH